MDPNNPQHGQMSTLSFAPTQGPQREMQKSKQPQSLFLLAGQQQAAITIIWRKFETANQNAHADYVFVDEHNRHKRLKGKLTWPPAPRQPWCCIAFC